MVTLSVPHPPEPAPGAPGDSSIVFEDVHIAFGADEVLSGVSFELKRGETKVLLGESGSGKTTILKLVLGLIRPDRGRILVLGEEVTRMAEEQLFDLRRKIGMVFQESALFDSLSVRQNVGYRLFEEKATEEEIDRRVREALRFVELESSIDLYPAELSGGMRRRVAIARAIITQPELLLYDSPTAGLDPVTSNTIIELILKQRDVFHTSALMVTHRLQDAFTMATHFFDTTKNQMRPLGPGKVDPDTTFLVLRGGHVIFNGSAIELANSANEYLREYLS